MYQELKLHDLLENYVFTGKLSHSRILFKRNSLSGTTTLVKSHRGHFHCHDISWWYHVNKLRAMMGNWSELAPAQRSPQYHVNTPLEHNIGVKALSDDFNTETAWNSKSWKSPFKLKCCLCNKNCSWCI